MNAILIAWLTIWLIFFIIDIFMIVKYRFCHKHNLVKAIGVALIIEILCPIFIILQKYYLAQMNFGNPVRIITDNGIGPLESQEDACERLKNSGPATLINEYGHIIGYWSPEEERRYND